MSAALRLRRRAEEYDRRGFFVFPLTGKHPWNYRTLDQFRDMGTRRLRIFGELDVTGIAILLGKPSRDLAAMDYDVEGTYDAWAAANPDLASSLPTVKTSRGHHVFHKSPDEPSRKVPGKGEYRANGNYVVGPESEHPEDGSRYLFKIPFRDDIPIVAPSVFGAVPETITPPAPTPPEPQGGTHEVSLSVGGVEDSSLPPFLCPTPGRETVEEVIRATLPTGPGQRHHKLFELARWVKSIQPNATDAELRRIARAWFRLARPFIRTDDPRVSEKDLTRAFHNVRHGTGTRFANAVAIAEADSFSVNGDLSLDRAARLFRALGTIHHGDPFHLAVRDLAEHAGCSRMTAHRNMQRLVGRGLLELVQVGKAGAKSRIATTWRWRGP